MQNVTLRNRGLYTFPNYLVEMPDGALTQADNVVIDRDGVVEPRRGFSIYGGTFSTSAIRAKQLMTYKGRVLRHWLSTVEYDTDGAGTFSALSASITEPSAGTRIKYVEANGNFYFTTSTGICKISATDASGVISSGVSAAGGVKALDGVGTLNSQTGFFVQDSRVAYRVVWGITDANQNVILGSPSPLTVIDNPMSSLLISDFNTLVGNLSKVAAADATQALSDTTYAQLKISGTSSPTVLYNNLITLASSGTNKLDTDLSLSGISLTTTAGSTTATVATSKNIQQGMLLSGNSNLATATTLQLTTIGSSSAASVPGTTGVSSGMLLSGNSNLDSGTTISSVAPGVVLNVLAGNQYTATATTGDYFDIHSSSTGVVYRFWFSVGSATAPSSVGVTLTPVTVLSTDSSAAVATKLTTAINTLSVFTVNTNNNIVTITGAGVGSPASSVVNTSFTMTSTNLILSSIAHGSATLTTSASSSTIQLTTTTGSPIATVLSTVGIVVGTLLSGNSSLPDGTKVSSVKDATTLILSNSATASGTVTTGMNNTTIVNVSSDGVTLTLSAPASSSGSAATTFSSVTFQNIAAPTTPGAPATTQQLTDIQTYFDNIVTALNSVAGISSTGKAAIGGSFANSTQSATVNLTFTIPSTITTAHFFQVYRSPLATSSGTLSLSDVAPSDELQLVYEDNPTSAQITAKSITYHDIVPETFREGGLPLYTNATSGEGIAQSNEVPPLAKDVTLYKNCTFYANTQSKHSKTLSLLSALSLAGQTLTITQGATVNTYTFVTNTAQVVSIACIAGSAFTASGTADYFDIYSTTNATTYRVWFSVGTVTAPLSTGVTLIQCTILNTDTSTLVAGKLRDALNTVSDFFASSATSTVTVTNQSLGYANAPVSHVANVSFTLTVSTAGAGEDPVNKKIGVSTAATPGQEVDETARSICRVLNENAAEVLYAYYTSGVNDVPGQMHFEARSLGASAFYITSSYGADFNPTLPASGQTVASDNQVVPNRIFYSKVQQPEAVPTVNYQDVGPKNKAVLRILPLRDSVFILSEAGVYRLAGDTPQTFQISLFDNTTRITAPDSAVVLNNQIFLLSDQGVVTISDTGINVISRPIEDKVLPVSLFGNFASNTFAVSYGTDRAYLLWTVANSNDSTATQCFRYNTFTQTWSRWPIAKTCGVVPLETNILYLGAGDVNSIERERKSFSRYDHADRQYSLSVSSVSSASVNLVTIGNTAVGDSLVQTQYLTISQFNRLLKKLDTDPGATYKNYFSTLGLSTGAELRGALTNLAAKLGTDTLINDTTFSSAIAPYTNSFVDCQSAFNVIVNKLNSNPNGLYKNYEQSTGTVVWEGAVISIFENIATTQYALPYIQGAVDLFKSIKTQITWAPHAFGDPSMLKHVNESTIIFQNVTFSAATAAYSSDLSTGLDSVTINGDGTGIWGGFSWGQIPFGGDGTSRPFRTLIPVNKQRSRYINCQFTHSKALEQYSIFGLSYSFNPVSNKAYR